LGDPVSKTGKNNSNIDLFLGNYLQILLYKFLKNNNMKKIIYLSLLVLITSCVSVPKETVILSRTIGSDINALHNSHLNMVKLYYGQIINDINTFVDDVYAPFIIHYVLKSELVNYHNDNPSIYGTIEKAAKEEGKQQTDDALQAMLEFQEAARLQIEKKRKELLTPVLKQQTEVTTALNQAYKNVSSANLTITEYLNSARKVKETQQESLSAIGLKGADSLINKTLVDFSEQINEVLKKGKEIDIKSDKAYEKIETISKKIKSITTNN
jgi:hypothetical protein